MTIESSVLATTTAGVGASSLHQVVVREHADQRLERAAADQLARQGELLERLERRRCPPRRRTTVVSSATGQLRNVPAKTPMAVRIIACSQMPNSPRR